MQTYAIRIFNQDMVRYITLGWFLLIRKTKMIYQKMFKRIDKVIKKVYDGERIFWPTEMTLDCEDAAIYVWMEHCPDSRPIIDRIHCGQA